MTANDKAILADILESAAMVVCTPSWHAKRSLAKASNGTGVPISSGQAVCFCAIGAIRAAANEIVSRVFNDDAYMLKKRMFIAFDAIEELRSVLPKAEVEVSDYNDARSTTGVMVAEKMWQAAQNLRSANDNS